ARQFLELAGCRREGARAVGPDARKVRLAGLGRPRDERQRSRPVRIGGDMRMGEFVALADDEIVLGMRRLMPQLEGELARGAGSLVHFAREVLRARRCAAGGGGREGSASTSGTGPR